MCKSKTNLARWMSLCALLSMIAIFTPMAAWGQTGISIAAQPNYDLQYVVNQTGISFTITISNNSGQSATLTLLRYVAACGQVTNFFPCDAGFADNDVFTLPASGTGSSNVPGNLSCQGATFTIGAADASTGVRTLTDSAGDLLVANGETCTITISGVSIANAPAHPLGGSGFGTVGLVGVNGHATTNAALPASGTGASTTSIPTCAVEVDKQTSCSSDFSTTIGDNNGLTTNNGEGTGGLTCQLGSNVYFRYYAKNTGGVDATCSFTDSQQTNAGGLPAIFHVDATGTIVVGDTQLVNGETSVTAACTADFAAHEPNSGVLACQCATSTTPVSANAFDNAAVDCKDKGVTLTKTCADQVDGLNHVTFTASNVGGVDLTACTITDTYYPNNTTCSNLPATGTTLDLTGGVFGLVVGDTNIDTGVSGDVSGAAANFCNTAHISCGSVFGDATADSSTVCNVPPPPGNCISRTPGYWGTHPNQTDSVIAGSLEVCGLTLTGFGLPYTNLSAVEDLCESNLDANSNNDTRTSSQQLQLIRQCTAAAINLKLSGNGDIAAGEQACSAFPNIATTFGNCCVGPTSTCDSGQTAQFISNSGCITSLDAFNNQFDNVSFPDGFVNEAAVPTYCGQATGNHFVNVDRNLGPAANGK